MRDGIACMVCEQGGRASAGNASSECVSLSPPYQRQLPPLLVLRLIRLLWNPLIISDFHGLCLEQYCSTTALQTFLLGDSGSIPKVPEAFECPLPQMEANLLTLKVIIRSAYTAALSVNCDCDLHLIQAKHGSFVLNKPSAMSIFHYGAALRASHTPQQGTTAQSKGERVCLRAMCTLMWRYLVLSPQPIWNDLIMNRRRSWSFQRAVLGTVIICLLKIQIMMLLAFFN